MEKYDIFVDETCFINKFLLTLESQLNQLIPQKQINNR